MSVTSDTTRQGSIRLSLCVGREFPHIVKVEELPRMGCHEVLQGLDELLEIGSVSGIGTPEPGGHVDDPDRWVRESLVYLGDVLPNVGL